MPSKLWIQREQICFLFLLSLIIGSFSLSLPKASVGFVETTRVEYFVIGTSHFRCQSANECTALIQGIEPDGVVIELDAERTLRLSKEASKDSHTDSETKNEIYFGEDFLASIKQAQNMDIPLFLGDESTKVIKDRFVRTILDMKSYNPMRLFVSIMSQRSTLSSRKINLFNVFLSDPQKAVPLITTTSIPFLLVLCSLGKYSTPEPVSIEIFLSIFISFFASCKVFNTLIVERDIVLASNAIRASEAIDSLRKGETIRKRWKFTVEDDYDALSLKSNSFVKDKIDNIPIFTLKNALELEAVRNLNLFEPRWLHMVDSLNNQNLLNDIEKPLQPQFGTVTCTNKFYSAIPMPDGKEGRYADLIFYKEGRMASLVDLKEGQRPSGARKINCVIRGGERIVLDEESLHVREEGYMVTTIQDIKCDNNIAALGQGKKSKIKIVIVAGLLHVNGIVQYLSNK